MVQQKRSSQQHSAFIQEKRTFAHQQSTSSQELRTFSLQHCTFHTLQRIVVLPRRRSDTPYDVISGPHLRAQYGNGGDRVDHFGSPVYKDLPTGNFPRSRDVGGKTFHRGISAARKMHPLRVSFLTEKMYFRSFPGTYNRYAPLVEGVRSTCPQACFRYFVESKAGI